MKGNIQIEGGSGNGIVFGDGSKITSAGGLWVKNGNNISFSEGNVGIGTGNNPLSAKLQVLGDIKVDGRIATREVCVNKVSSWCDYVFEPGYKLPKLENVKSYLEKNRHLADEKSLSSRSA